MRVHQSVGLLERVTAATADVSDLPGLAQAVYTSVSDVIPFGFACFATADPASGLPNWSSKTRPTGCGDEEFTAVEFGGPDINTLAEVAQRTPPVGALWVETDGHPETCRRYREFLQPRFGFTDELRVVFRSRGAMWGALALYREREEEPFTAEQARQLGTISGLCAEAVQRRLFAPTPPAARDVPAGPAVLIIDAAERVTQLSPAAAAAIEELGGWDRGSLPTSVLAVATVARTGSAASETRAQTVSGRWLSLRAARLTGPPGQTDQADVVVSFEATRPGELSRLAFAAHGLSRREEDVAVLVLQGANTRAIASALCLSPHTVQDHLKAIFAKLGVNSRREMIARLVLN